MYNPYKLFSIILNLFFISIIFKFDESKNKLSNNFKNDIILLSFSLFTYTFICLKLFITSLKIFIIIFLIFNISSSLYKENGIINKNIYMIFLKKI